MLNLKNLFQNTKSEPYRKAFNRSYSSKLIIKGSIRQRLSWRFCVSPRRNGNIRKKCLIVSISVPQLHMGLTQPLNL